MTGILEATTEDEVLVTYCTTMVMGRGIDEKQRPMRRVKKGVGTASAAVDLTRDLWMSSARYAALSNTTHEFWREYGQTAQGHIAVLDLLRMVQMRPLLLAILDVFQPAEARKAIKFLVDCAVRILMVGARGGAVEVAYCEAAKNVRSGPARMLRTYESTWMTYFPPCGIPRCVYGGYRLEKLLCPLLPPRVGASCN